jgi:hypothetical protein
VVLLAGGNPQIAKGDGDAPVQAYMAAVPGWKSDLGRRLDAPMSREAPGVRKAVRWNSPFYGIKGQGWFLTFHVPTEYVKVIFFQGRFPNPVPSGGTPRSGDARWIDIREQDWREQHGPDEARMAAWARQAAVRPGWVPWPGRGARPGPGEAERRDAILSAQNFISVRGKTCKGGWGSARARPTRPLPGGPAGAQDARDRSTERGEP